jgi:phosphate:Na+ symporter
MIYMNVFGGVLLLLYGIKMVNDGLQNAAGPRIRSLLRSLTSNRLTAVGAGAFITGLIQSSSATSVMLVGFVSAGLMTFRQTLAVVLGADIGATLTVQLIAFHIYDYAVFLVGIGLVFVLFARSHLYRNIGQGLVGFGFVFLSIKIMSEAMAPLEQSELFRQVLIALVGTPVGGILLSAVLTALIHSSAATIALALALAGHGLIPLHAAIYVVLGANIGTCSTALMASLRSPAEARRVAWAHVLFKLLGVALFLPFLHPFAGLVTLTTPDLSRQIANAHTLFNVIMALLFLPLVGPFSKLVARLVPAKAEEKKFGPAYLDEHVLATPALAVGQATREVLRVSDIVRDMLVNSIKVFQSDDPSLIQAVKEKDNFVDILDREIRLYLTRLSSTSLTETQSHRGVALLEITRNLENIGDIIDRNLMPLAAKRINKGVVFTQEGMEEIVLFHRKLVENYDMAISAFAGHDRDLGDRVLRNKEELGIVERELVQAHIERLRKGLRESIETSHIHLDIISNLARINSLITHIIYPIFEETRGAAREDMGLEKRQGSRKP